MGILHPLLARQPQDTVGAAPAASLGRGSAGLIMGMAPEPSPELLIVRAWLHLKGGKEEKKN